MLESLLEVGNLIVHSKLSQNHTAICILQIKNNHNIKHFFKVGWGVGGNEIFTSVEELPDIIPCRWPNDVKSSYLVMVCFGGETVRLL